LALPAHSISSVTNRRLEQQQSHNGFNYRGNNCIRPFFIIQATRLKTLQVAAFADSNAAPRTHFHWLASKRVRGHHDDAKIVQFVYSPDQVVTDTSTHRVLVWKSNGLSQRLQLHVRAIITPCYFSQNAGHGLLLPEVPPSIRHAQCQLFNHEKASFHSSRWPMYHNLIVTQHPKNST
jgi:hypothetical protein